MWKPALSAGLASLVLLAGCAPKTTPPDLAAEALARAIAAAGRAESRVLDGCYACLLEARETYGELLASPLAEAVRPRLFETTLLVLLREKELGLPYDDSWAKAKTAAVDLPAGYDAARLLAVVEAVPPETEGIGVLPAQEFRRARLPYAKQVPAELTWLVTTPLQPTVRTYLSLALACAELAGPYRDPRAIAGEPGEPTLLVYRRNICVSVRSLEKLEAIRNAVPAFVETNYFIAKGMASRLATGISWQTFRERLAASLEAYPSSPAANALGGRGQQLLGNCRGAIDLYERTIALAPRHEDAWLGKTMCLSFLGQAEQSIQAATSLIALKSDSYLRDAYYWRAANYHHLKDLTSARADIEASKRRGFTIEILTLAGIIEYEQDALADAQSDLQRAQQLSELACAPTWYLGLVHIKRAAWSDAGASFFRAVSCYLEAAAEAGRKLTAVENAKEIDPEYRQQQLAALKAAIVEYTRQRRASAINAAMCLTNSGDLSRNDALIAIAAEDPELAPEIDRLRGHIKAYYEEKK
jgi:hypothetical protein